MKSVKMLIVVVAVLGLLATGCAPATLVGNMLTLTPQDSRMLNVMDYTTMVGLLRSAGHTVEETGTLDDSLFAGEGRTITVNGHDVQVYEYATPEDMEKDAANIGGAGSMFTTADGSVVQIDFMSAPHFFKSGRVMVLYVGNEAAAFDALQALLGEPFQGGGLGSGPVEPVSDYASLIRLLGEAGHTVEETGPLPDSFFAGEGRVIKVNGQDVQVYEYATPEEMEADAANLDGAGTIFKSADGSVMQIDWIDTPHFFKSGRVIVQYIGRDEVVYTALESLMGGQFIGGDFGSGGGFLPPNVTPGDPGLAPFADVASLTAALESVGASVVAGEAIEAGMFSVGGQILKLGDQDVQVFAFADEAAAVAETATISPDGGTIGDTPVRWDAPPHFYQSGALIVLYVGDDPGITMLLESVLGPQFAGS